MGMNTDCDKAYSGAFVGNTHHFALRVYIEDTDFGGVVYHANYLRYLERARSDMLRAAGIDQRAAVESGVGVYAVAEVRIRYRIPARLDDELVILSRLQDVRGASCIIAQQVMRGNEVLAEASVRAAFITPEGRPRRQPREWVATFERLRALK